MNTNEIIQMISTIGFPVVMCIALSWYVKYSTDQNNQRIDEMTAKHQEEIKTVTEALNNNTLALQKLCDKLDI